MEFSVKPVSSLTTLRTDCLVLPMAPGKKPSHQAALVDEALSGQITELLKNGDITGKPGNSLILHNPVGLAAKRLILVGTGPHNKIDASGAQKWLTTVAAQLQKMPIKTAAVVLNDLSNEHLGIDWLAQQLGQQLIAAGYRYTETKTEKGDKTTLKGLTALVEEEDLNRSTDALNQGRAIGLGMNLARHLGDLPGNICTPSYLANQGKALAAAHKSISCEILGEKEMKALKMGSFLSVSAGSEEPARLIAMTYKGGKAGSKPVVLVGKGVTFDSGGISIKPGPKMDEMKYDMCGAASVFGTLKAIAELNLPLHVVGLVGATENLPSGKATKPGDVVTSMSGQTIEILNTDAEGRLVLCDVLTYAAKYKPEVVIDIATLTGACVVALGGHASGLFANNDELATALLAAGRKTHDRAWQMPLWDEYNKQLDSNFADMQNIGGPEGGSVTAACFLSRFTKDYTWAHLDIAGTAWSGSPKGASGRPVPLLTQYLLDRVN